MVIVRKDALGGKPKRPLAPVRSTWWRYSLSVLVSLVLQQGREGMPIAKTEYLTEADFLSSARYIHNRYSTKLD